MADLELTAKRFSELTLEELYGLLVLRAEVFVVEQACPYLDPDGHDREATHLLGRVDDELMACARWYLDGDRVRLGRIATAGHARGRGLGRALVAAALARITAEHPGLSVRIHAQSYLRSFYQALGFAAEGEPFEEDGIPHLVMVRSPPEAIDVLVLSP